MNTKKTVRRLKKALASSRKKAGRSMASAMKVGMMAGAKGMSAGARSLKAGRKKLKEAERSGALDRWKTRVGLGLRALEVAAVATAAYKGAHVKVGKGRAAAKRGRRKTTARKASR